MLSWLILKGTLVKAQKVKTNLKGLFTMKLSFKFSVLNAASIALIAWMIYVLITNPKNQGGDGLSNFFPLVGIISGSLGLILDQILQASISNRIKVNIIELIIILAAIGYLIYVLKN